MKCDLCKGTDITKAGYAYLCNKCNAVAKNEESLFEKVIDAGSTSPGIIIPREENKI